MNERRTTPALVLIAVIGSLLVSAPPIAALEPRIVGGVPVPITDAPWQVLVSIRDQELCGGSVLNATSILTAAHCVDRVTNAPDVRVVAGTEQLNANGVQRRATSIAVHPAWDRTTYRNDLAIVTLDAPLEASTTIGPIRLPATTDPWPPAGTPASVFGWGSRETDGAAAEVLQRGEVVVLTSPGDPTCGSYGALFDPATQICAGVAQGGVDACQGDSGGALTVAMPDGWTIAGIVSTGRECGVAEFPGLYTRVTEYLPWIQGLVTPLGLAPSAPQAVSARSPRPGRVRVTWQPPVVDGGVPVTEYVATAGRKTCRTASNVCTFKKLRRNRPVTVQVQAINAVGESRSTTTRIRVR